MAGPTAAERVYQHIYGGLEDGSLHAGAVLREEQLAQDCGTSRTPVREALNRLVQDGICERHGAGVRVSRLTLPRVHEIYPIVSALEGLAARLCALRMDEATLATLLTLHQQMIQAAEAEDHSQYVTLNQTFHDQVLDATDNPTLVQTVRRLRLVTAQLRSYQLGLTGRMAASSAEHAALLDAFRQGEPVIAETQMRAHVDSGYRLLAEALRSITLVEPHQEVPVLSDLIHP